jgi:hypothetical protein
MEHWNKIDQNNYNKEDILSCPFYFDGFSLKNAVAPLRR